MLPQFMKLVDEAKKEIKEIDAQALRQMIEKGSFTRAARGNAREN